MMLVRQLSAYVLLGIVIAAGVLWYQHAQKKSKHPTSHAPSVVTLVESEVRTDEDNQSRHLNTGPFSYSLAVKKALPSVVNIYTKRVQYEQRLQNPLYDRFFGTPSQQRQRVKTGSGSGVIVSQSGHLLTNYHVIRGATAVHVLLSDGRDFPAQLIGVDPDTDLAVLKIQADNLTPIVLSNKQPVSIGDVVLAIGNPFGVGQTVTMGIVSAKGRDRLGLSTYESFIQTDAAINPGNSGGALVNANGTLVGINTAIFTKDGGTQGIGFAIPVNIATHVLKQIIEFGRVVRGWIGVEGQDINSAIKERYKIPAGIVVSKAVPGGPAHMAGVRRGDIITHINNRVVKDAHDVVMRIAALKPGDSLDIKGIRASQTFEATLIAVQRPLFNR